MSDVKPDMTDDAQDAMQGMYEFMLNWKGTPGNGWTALMGILGEHCSMPGTPGHPDYEAPPEPEPVEDDEDGSTPEPELVPVTSIEPDPNVGTSDS